MSLALQQDQKIVLGGSQLGTLSTGNARLNADGKIDASFPTILKSSTSTDSSLANYYSLARSVVALPDGRLLVAGEFQTVNGLSRSGIARLEASGKVDASFGIGQEMRGSISAVVPQTDGKIIIGGWFEAINLPFLNGVARLKSDGTPDTAFSVGPGANAPVRSLAIQRDGRILIGGEFTNFSGEARSAIARVHGGEPAQPIPVIISHPISRAATEGGDVKFAVQAIGRDLQFQWQRNGVDLPGETLPTLQLAKANVHPDKAGLYTVKVSNQASSVTSQQFSL